MNTESADRRSRESSGRRHLESSRSPGLLSARELVEKLEMRERLAAIRDELDRLDADVDVPRTLCEGLAEDLDALLAQEGPA